MRILNKKIMNSISQIFQSRNSFDLVIICVSDGSMFGRLFGTTQDV